MTEHAAVLFANEAFYTAFATRDLDAMESVWANRSNVCCIHPGWSALSGRDQVMSSWRAILSSSESPEITFAHPRVSVYEGLATVVCYEVLNDGFLVATNLFVKENGSWKIVHHQAGPTDGPSEEDEENAAPTPGMQ